MRVLFPCTLHQVPVSLRYKENLNIFHLDNGVQCMALVCEVDI